MPDRHWSIGRILLFWCAWPILLLALLAAAVMRGGGFSLDLLHPAAWPLLLLVLVGPPLVATIAWGRR
jgi:hypothetical protein